MCYVGTAVYNSQPHCSQPHCCLLHCCLPHSTTSKLHSTTFNHTAFYHIVGTAVCHSQPHCCLPHCCLPQSTTHNTTFYHILPHSTFILTHFNSIFTASYHIYTLFNQIQPPLNHNFYCESRFSQDTNVCNQIAIHVLQLYGLTFTTLCVLLYVVLLLCYAMLCANPALLALLRNALFGWVWLGVMYSYLYFHFYFYGIARHYLARYGLV